MTRWRSEDVHLVLLGTHLNQPQRRTWADWKRVVASLFGLSSKEDEVLDSRGTKSKTRVRRGGFGRIGKARRIAS